MTDSEAHKNLASEVDDCLPIYKDKVDSSFNQCYRARHGTGKKNLEKFIDNKIKTYRS